MKVLTISWSLHTSITYNSFYHCHSPSVGHAWRHVTRVGRATSYVVRDARPDPRYATLARVVCEEVSDKGMNRTT